MHILAYSLRHEYLLPEHALQVLLKNQSFLRILKEYDSHIDRIQKELNEFLESLEKVPEDVDYKLSFSSQFDEVIEGTIMQLASSGKNIIEIPHIVFQILQLEESMAAYLLNSAIDGDTGMFMSDLVTANEPISDPLMSDVNSGSSRKNETKNVDQWRNFVTCLNDSLERKNPLIGREKELDRTIQVLCRKDKNNPLHIGEPGVGKTALVYGLARWINEGKVPEKLKGARIYSLDIGSLLAGTQFRGDFEKRLKTIMDGVSSEDNAIVYIDEIHNLVGAGATGEGSMDASNMLKPYLESGTVRFIGSTTYDEYKRYFAKSKGLVRRFSRIDIEEPSEEEAMDILTQLKANYEQYHGVTYLPEAIEFAVKGSARHITDRFLPDKAIDLIDEAGAYRQAHPEASEKEKIIDKALIAAILSKVCKVDAVAISKDSLSSLETLQDRILGKIYGQEEAVSKVVEAVMMSKAGLSDEEKPLASLLFVGPTGTGKTELAKTLASELGIGFLRFDMSEYSEKHAVAKLIGSPAGYVGYEDGGILTDAIRKTPDCVLLLDEIEKAHADIYNILLQVMDYGRLADNKGNKADFRNVILIMTSNAGASFAAQAKVGFASSMTAGNAMLKQVKKTFQPEFINRLSAIVVFNEIDRKMASLILDKKLRILEDKLNAKNVRLSLSDEAKEYLLREGFSKEYGAREIDRVIDRTLKPILMKELLFGTLKNGGSAQISYTPEEILTLKETFVENAENADNPDN
ncbi:MAG: AAA family ATPase [Muribaculaceae bacterium]|nr:AAA family ATPase [Muribaculaceae bacterium]